jgi:DNA-binding beta-propeller fold protein YncE
MMFEIARARETAHRRRARLFFFGFGVPCFLWWLAPTLAAQEREPAPKYEMRPAYPRTNLSTAYEAVPSWPARPKNLTWGAVAGIAISPSDQIWTFNRGTVPVQVYTASGELVRSWGQGQFREPHQVRIDHDGGVWLVDSGLHVVKKFTPEGKLLLTLGTAGEPGEDSTHLNRPTDVAVAPGGDTFVADGYGNNRVVHFDERGQFVGTWGSLGSGPGQFSLPHSIALDSRGRLFVADRNNARVQVFDQAGRFLDEWRDLLVPWHIAITDRDEIYVCGSSPMRWPKLPIPGLIVGIPPKDQLVMVFTPDGRLTRLCTFPKGQHPGELDWVHALGVDRLGNLYLGDIQGRRVQKFLRLEPAGREGPIAKDGRPKRDDPVQRAGKP